VNDKTLAQQHDSQDLAIVLVTFDENDATKLCVANGCGRRTVRFVLRRHGWQSI
jgi:hypothetical protein